MTNPNAGTHFSCCEESFYDEATSFLKANNSNGVEPNSNKSDLWLVVCLTKGEIYSISRIDKGS